MPTSLLNMVPQILAGLLTLILTLVGIFTGGSVGSSSNAPQPGNPSVTSPSNGNFNVAADQTRVFNELNKYRAKYGLEAVQRSSTMDQRAQEWANYLAETGQFYHDPKFNERENIAIIMTNDVSEAVWNIWHNSSGHRANMRADDAKHAGHGVAIMKSGKFKGQKVIVQKISDVAVPNART